MVLVKIRCLAFICIDNIQMRFLFLQFSFVYELIYVVLDRMNFADDIGKGKRRRRSRKEKKVESRDGNKDKEVD